jgi:hypothetical protein
MAQGTKIALRVLGSIFVIIGISCFAFGSSMNLPVAPLIGAFSTFVGFICLVLGFMKKEDDSPAKPVEAPKQA